MLQRVVPFVFLLSIALLSLRDAAAAPSVASLNLQARDFSVTVSLVTEKDQNAAQYAAARTLTLKAVQQQGIVHANGRDFLVPVTSKNTPAHVASQVTLLTTTAKAQVLYQQLQGALAGESLAAFHPLLLGALGQQRFGVLGTDTTQDPPEPEDILVFQRGRYVVLLWIMYATPQFGAAQAQHLATILDGRLTHAA